jgi:hypothetical protein
MENTLRAICCRDHGPVPVQPDKPAGDEVPQQSSASEVIKGARPRATELALGGPADLGGAHRPQTAATYVSAHLGVLGPGVGV